MLSKIGNNRNSHSLLVEMQNDTATLEDRFAVSYKVKYNLIIIQKLCSYVFTQLSDNLCLQKCPHMNVYSQNIIARNWKHLRCSSIADWIHKMWQKMGYSAINSNKFLSQDTTQKNLKCILLTERSQNEKGTYCIIPIMTRHIDQWIRVKEEPFGFTFFPLCSTGMAPLVVLLSPALPASPLFILAQKRQCP